MSDVEMMTQLSIIDRILFHSEHAQEVSPWFCGTLYNFTQVPTIGQDSPRSSNN